MKRFHSFFIVLFIIHFVFILIYMLPSGPLNDLTHPIVSKYIEPIFEQRWHLFAPEPLTFSSRVIAKCSDSSDWIDPTKTLLEKNSNFPIVHVQRSIFLFNSISAYLLDLRTTF